MSPLGTDRRDDRHDTCAESWLGLTWVEHSVLGMTLCALLCMTHCSRHAQSPEREAAASLNDRGATHLRRGEYELAARDFSEAIRLWPKFAMAFANRAFAHA